MKVHHIKSYGEFTKSYGAVGIVNEGGNALNTTQRIANKDIPNTLEYITAKILPTIGLEGFDIDAAVVGSAGKKDPDVTSGDIDIAVSIDKIAGHAGIDVKGVLKYINDTLAAKGYETNIQYGFHQVNVAVPIDGDTKKGYCQVDLMVTDNLDWSKFIYFSPDYRKAESRYSGAFRGMLINAVASEGLKKAVKHDEESGEMEEYEQMVNRATHGLFKVRKTLRGKKGLIKTPKLMKDYEQKISNIPSEVIKILFGDGVTEKDVESFEGIWKVIHSKGFPYQGKLETIANKFLWYMKNMEIPVPTEIVEKYPNLIKENQTNMKSYVKLYEEFVPSSINEGKKVLADKEGNKDTGNKIIDKYLKGMRQGTIQVAWNMISVRGGVVDFNNNVDFTVAYDNFKDTYMVFGNGFETLTVPGNDIKNDGDLHKLIGSAVNGVSFTSESNINENYNGSMMNTVAKFIKISRLKKGNTSMEELLQFISDNFKDITGQDYNDPYDFISNDHIANIISFYKYGEEVIDKWKEMHESEVNEDQTKMDFGGNELGDIVTKFMELNPTKKGTKYTHTYGAGTLTLDIKGDKIRGAEFSVDRAHDFLKHMEEKGFGPDIYGTLETLAKDKKLKGYNTILMFESLNEDQSLNEAVAKQGKKLVNIMVGRFQPFHNGHYLAAKELHDKNGLPVVLASVRAKGKTGKGTSFTDATMDKMMKDVIKKSGFIIDNVEIPFVAFDTKLFPALRPKYEPVLFGAGEDRVATYDRQRISMRDKHENKLNMRDDFEIQLTGRYGSGTAVRNAIEKGDQKEFESTMPKFLHNYWETLSSELGMNENQTSLNELRNDGLLSDVDNIDQILMNTKNRRAARDWEEYTEDLFADYEGEVHQVAFRINSPGGITWADIEDSDIKAAIDVGQDIMNRYKIKESVNEGKLNYKDTGLKGEYLRDVKNGVKGIQKALKSGNERNIIHNYDIVQQRVQQYGEGPNRYDFLDAVQKLAGIEESVNEANKIACLDCDEVNTEAKWKKNNGFCPSCKTSNQGVAESVNEDDTETIDDIQTDGPIAEEPLDRVSRTIDDCKDDLAKTGASIERLKAAIENGAKEPKAFEALAKLQKIHGTLILEMANMIKNK